MHMYINFKTIIVYTYELGFVSSHPDLFFVIINKTGNKATHKQYHNNYAIKCTAYMLYLYVQHNLFCDNCHSHVARSLNLMRYGGSSSWNMYKLGFLMVFKGKFTG